MSEVLIVFAKAPHPGEVKTRLVPPLTPEEAAALYEASLGDVLENARKVADDTRIYFDPVSGAEAYMASRFPDVPRAGQCAGDLGQRLAAAFDDRFGGGATRVIVIGADSPTLPTDRISTAFDVLREAPAVLGPAEDGGYYLIGLERSVWPRASALFREIPWSTADVRTATVAAAGRVGISIHHLAPWYDIDRVEDLRRARADAAEPGRFGRVLECLAGRFDRESSCDAGPVDPPRVAAD